MPGLINPNVSIQPANPFNPNTQASGPFMPRSFGSEMYTGKAQPQPGPVGYNSDVVAKPPVKNKYGAEIDYLQGQIPNPVGPYVPPPTAGLVNQLTAMQGQYADAAVPLLAQLLSAQQQQYGIANAFFGPEMALRQGLMDVISQQDTGLLEQLLAAQEQLSAGLQPKSGSFYFAGF